MAGELDREIEFYKGLARRVGGSESDEITRPYCVVCYAGNLCTIMVGEVQFDEYFPEGVLNSHNIRSGDTFDWFPSNDGSVSRASIRNVKKAAVSAQSTEEIANHLERIKLRKVLHVREHTARVEMVREE